MYRIVQRCKTQPPSSVHQQWDPQISSSSFQGCGILYESGKPNVSSQYQQDTTMSVRDKVLGYLSERTCSTVLDSPNWGLRQMYRRLSPIIWYCTPMTFHGATKVRIERRNVAITQSKSHVTACRSVGVTDTQSNGVMDTRPS